MTDKSFAEKDKKIDPKKSPIIIGLDIGTTKIACFVGRKNEHNKIEIIAKGKSESLGVAHGVVSNIERTVQSISNAIKEAEKCEDGYLSIKNVYVGIAGQHIKSKKTKGMYTRRAKDGEISQVDIDNFLEDMYEMVMDPGEEIITVIPQEYIVDNQQDIKDPIGMAGKKMEANFHIITGQVSNVMNIKTCIERCELKVKDIILEPIASATAVLSEEEKEAGVVLVDIGGGTTDVAIFHDNLIRHTAVIPYGGNILTQDIKEGCKILNKHAETLKVKFGSALASESKDSEVVIIPMLRGRSHKEITLKNLASIIQARMEEIIELVKYEINNSGYSNKLIGGIVVTGGGSQLKHLTQLFEYMTGMDTRIGYPTEHLANSNEIKDISSPIYSTGVGLVLKGFEEFEQQRRSGKEIKDNIETVVTHSGKTRGGFYDKILSGIKKIFDAEEEI